MNLQYHIGGDGDFRALDQAVEKINRVQDGHEAVARLNDALAQREFNRLPNLEKIVRLKEQERRLVEEAGRQQGLGNTGAAANFALEALKKREQLEGVVLQMQREQAAAAKEAAAAEGRAANAAQQRAADLARANAANAQSHAKIAADLERQAESSRKVAEEADRAAAAAKAREQAAVSELNDALKASRFDRSTPQEKINALRKQEAELARQAVAAESGGNRELAARSNLALLQTRQRIEQQVTLEKNNQAAAQERNQRASERTLAAARAEQQAHASDRSQKVDAAAGLLGVPLGIGAVFATIKGFMADVTAMAGGIKDSAEQLDITTQEVQQLSRAAKASGLDINDFSTAISQIGSARKSAAEGSEEDRAKFARFGITLEQLNNPALRNIDLLKQLSAATGDLNAADRQALKEMLGRRGDRLGSALVDLSKAGAGGISDEAIQSLDRYEKAGASVFSAIRAAGAEAFAALNNMTEDFWLKLRGGGTSATTSPEARDAADYEQAQQAHTAPEHMRGGAARYAEFKEFQRVNFEAEQAALRAMLDAQVEGNLPEANKQKALREKAAANQNMSYPEFHRTESTAALEAKAKEAALYKDNKAKKDALDLEQAQNDVLAKRQALQFSLMSAEEQRAELLRRMSELDFQLAMAEANENPLAKARLEGQRVDLEAKMAGLKDDAPGRTALAPPSADALRRIGGFTGGVGGSDPVATKLEAIHALMGGNLRAFAELRQNLQNGVAVNIKS